MAASGSTGQAGAGYHEAMYGNAIMQTPTTPKMGKPIERVARTRATPLAKSFLILWARLKIGTTVPVSSWSPRQIPPITATQYESPLPNSFQSMNPNAAASPAPMTTTIRPARARLVTSRQKASDLAHSDGQNCLFTTASSSVVTR